MIRIVEMGKEKIQSSAMMEAMSQEMVVLNSVNLNLGITANQSTRLQMVRIYVTVNRRLFILNGKIHGGRFQYYSTQI